MVSYIIFQKLPVGIKRELIHKVQSNYPTIDEIFSNISDIIKCLNKTKPLKFKSKNDNYSSQDNKNDYKNGKNDHKNNKNEHNKNKFENKNNNFDKFNKYKSEPTSSGTVETFKTMHKKHIYCKFCKLDTHSMIRCEKCPDFESRVKRCKILSICPKCSSDKHDGAGESCRGIDFSCYYCSENTHISALCGKSRIEASAANGSDIPISNNGPKTNSNLCLSARQGNSEYILPTLTVEFAVGSKIKYVRCILDTASQRSYVSGEVASYLCDVGSLDEVKYEINTFIGTKSKTFKECIMALNIDIQPEIKVPILVDDHMDLSFNIPGMNHAIRNLSRNSRLADIEFDEQNDNCVFNCQALLGIDILQHLQFLSLSKVLGGSGFELENGKLIPFGDVNTFLSDNDKPVPSVSQISNDLEVSPIKTYFSPVCHLFQESSIEQGFENLFNLEAMGISEGHEDLSDFDEMQIKKFREEIEFKNNHYYVALPFYEDRLKYVPSNHQLALKILGKVINDLRVKNILKEYEDAFKTQIDEDFLEFFEADELEYHNFIWLSHRPVIKKTIQTTTKIRPVINASLKPGGRNNKHVKSVNECAYPGVCLVNKILKLVLYFRTNQIFMTADIKAAYMNIRLKYEADKNRFAIFMYFDGVLKCLRYTCITFGYVSSMFIMHYVIRYHLEQFPDDRVKEILTECTYVDNTICTGNSVEEMKKIYKICYERMNSASFNLRSWVSNVQELNDLFIEDENYVTHGTDHELILGVLYNKSSDTVTLNELNMDFNAKSKRQILAEISKPYDALNLMCPITIKGRLLMRHIHMLEPKLGWNDEVTDDVIKIYKKIATEYMQLHTIYFKRFAVSESEEYGLHCCCDSSLLCFGFVMYASNKNGSNFIYAKNKLAPKTPYSVPTLECLAVTLCMSCLDTILSSLKNIKFKFINIAVDAEVVLSWILSKELKMKSQFVRNRIKDINLKRENLTEKYGIPIFFNYIETTRNSSDMLTRPNLTINKFKEKLEFWLTGVEWFSDDLKDWPKYDLMCVSPDVVNPTIVQVNLLTERLIDFTRFSSKNKLFKIVTLVFKFYIMARKLDTNPSSKAELYIYKTLQKDCFEKEIDYLNSNASEKVEIPQLVNNLNLFFDEMGILRCRGRLSRCVYFNYDVCNPILLGKEHHVTSLIIMDAHLRVQHLGLQTTLSKIRESGYWIPKARFAIKKVIGNCITCKKVSGLAFRYPRFTNMPKHYVNFVTPFKYVGVDNTSHLWVVNEKDQTTSKFYLLIFTCLNIRAIHLEAIPDLTAKSFLLAFIRFCNLYVIPTYLYSDNAANFIKGGSVLNDALSSDEFTENLRKNNIQHVKIPLYSAWFGSY